MSDNDAPTPANGLLGGAAVFVVAMAAIFGVIGLVRDDTPGLEVLDGGDTVATSEPSTEPTTTGPDTLTPEPTITSTDATPDATSTPTESGTDAPLGDIAPAEISIQVLDGTGGDPDAFQGVIDDLTAAGYSIQATFASRRVYDMTTVFYTPGGDGNEEAGEQVAAALGFDVVLATPDDVNLSDSVRVHVVVGADA